MILGPRASEECSIAGSIGPKPEGPPVNEMTNSRSIQPASPALAQTLDGPAVRVTTLPSPPPGTSQAPSKPANTNSAPPARMRWPQLGPMDIVWLTHLAEFRPFAVQKKVNERFHMCTAHIKVSEAWFECLMSFSLTLRPAPLSNVCRHMQTQPKCLSCSQAIPKTTTLRNRYDYLSKTWLLAAKAASQRASGTQETDEELCVLIKVFVLQEEVCPVLIPQSMKCAGKAFRSSRAPHCPRRS